MHTGGIPAAILGKKRFRLDEADHPMAIPAGQGTGKGRRKTFGVFNAAGTPLIEVRSER